MRRLLLLYPPAWRARYGEELDQLVSDSGGLGPRASLDLINGALHERVRTLRSELVGGGGMTIGPAYRHPTGLAIAALAVLAPVLVFVIGSMLVYQFGLTSLQPPMDSANAWLNAAPRFVDLLLIVSPAVAL